MKRMIIGLLVMVMGIAITGCSSSSENNGSSSSTTGRVTDIFSETEYVGGVVTSIVPGRAIYVELEGNQSTPTLSDTGSHGEDEFTIHLDSDIVLDLCALLADENYVTNLISSDGKVIMDWHEGYTDPRCTCGSVVPVNVPAGDYTLKLWSDPANPTSTQFQLISLEEYSDSVSENISASMAKSATTGGVTHTLNGKQIPEYSMSATYSGMGLANYKGKVYLHKGWVGAGQCPLAADCPASGGYDADNKPVFASWIWQLYDPNVSHEFVYYDRHGENGYKDLQAEYLKLSECTCEQYKLSNVKAAIDASVKSGEISRGAPVGGFTQADKDALYREYMLPCRPNLDVNIPANVALVKQILPKSLWDTIAGNIAYGDSSLKTYSWITETAGDLTIGSAAWPKEEDFNANSYNNFLTAVARYPYFCGEAGYFGSTEEACKREISSLFAHAAFETGNTLLVGDSAKTGGSFFWLREYGFVDGVSFFKTGCAAPLDCETNGFARYYGRGPKQLTYYFNYAGFSAAYYNGNYNYLLKWPDLVAYDGKLNFESALFYVMTNQPPKPSIHDIILGRYKPSTGCVTPSNCYGVQYDATSGVKNNFGISIEAVNGGLQCRTESDADAKGNARGRTRAYKEMLGMLDATLTADEIALTEGCSFITIAKATKDTIFGYDILKAGLNTWLDLSASSCKANSIGGLSTISVTAKGIVDACIACK